MNYKRGKPRDQVRCVLCTSGRMNIGGDRQRREREAQLSDSPRVTNGRFYDWCPDCNGTGQCGCTQCRDTGVGCAACLGAKVIDYGFPRATG